MISSEWLTQIFSEIKEMNIIFERPEWMGANWDNEYGFFVEEIGELQEEGKKDDSLIGASDALVDICVFAIGALHKDGFTTQDISKKISWSHFFDIHSITSVQSYKDNIGNILFSIIFTLNTLFTEKVTVALFHEVYLSNMSKLKDGKPVPGNLPGKFGKNLETYFKPNLAQYIQA